MIRKLILITLCACVNLACARVEAQDTMKVIAHRGGASLGAENTLGCIRKGILSGANAIEVDVHLSADGELVVCHDETLNRTTSGRGRIEELTLDQIRSVSIKKGEPGEKVPTLEEVVREVKDHCILLLEVKKSREGQYPGIEDKIVDLLVREGMMGQVVLQSFNDGVLERFYALAPELPLEKLLICRLPFGLAFDIKLHRFSFADYPHVRSFNSYYGLTSRRFVHDVHAQGKTVRVWTVNKPSQVPQGVDAVITNYPQRFLPNKGR